MPHVYIVDLLVQGHAGQLRPVYLPAPPGSPPNPMVVKAQSSPDPDRVAKVSYYINLLAKAASDAKSTIPTRPDTSQITRLTTDEFSFYPQGSPFTLDEYKSIIKNTAAIAKTLAPDIHIVLATFPVIWPDGGVHNCGLYVQSANASDQPPIIHHFSKQLRSDSDFVYQKDSDSNYPLTSDRNCRADQLPNVVLKDTDISTNDVNQCGAALKITTSNKGEFISTIGICLDHAQGIEKHDVRGLIEQLQKNNLPVPAQCSHVITSYTIPATKDNVVSTVSHADPNPEIRQPPQKEKPVGFWSTSSSPPTSQCVKTIVPNPFSAFQTVVERYPEKKIGTLHSALFLHAFSRNTVDSTSSQLNAVDENGNTELHRVFLDDRHDNELIGKRAYAMILAGGDPTIRDRSGKSVIELAQETSPIISAYISAAIAHCSRQHLAQKSTTESSLRERLLMVKGNVKQFPPPSQFLTFIQDGGNPYQKGADNKSAMDLVSDYFPFDRVFLIGQLQTMFELVHAYPLTQKTAEISSAIEKASIWSPENYHNFMQSFSRKQQELIIQEMKVTLTKFIDINDEEKLGFFIVCLGSELSNIIGSFSDFKALMSKLSETDRDYLFTFMKYKLASFADFASAPELSQILSRWQLQWIETVAHLGADQQQFLTDHETVKKECLMLLGGIYTFKLPFDDPLMLAFLREKNALAKTSTDMQSIRALKTELQHVLNTLRQDKITPEIINTIKKLYATTNLFTLAYDQGKAKAVNEALRNVPIELRHEIMNDDVKTPEIVAVREALASHRLPWKRGSERNADQTINENKAAQSYKMLKERYRAQREESSNETDHSEETKGNSF